MRNNINTVIETSNEVQIVISSIKLQSGSHYMSNRGTFFSYYHEDPLSICYSTAYLSHFLQLTLTFQY